MSRRYSRSRSCLDSAISRRAASAEQEGRIGCVTVCDWKSTSPAISAISAAESASRSRPLAGFVEAPLLELPPALLVGKLLECFAIRYVLEPEAAAGSDDSGTREDRRRSRKGRERRHELMVPAMSVVESDYERLRWTLRTGVAFERLDEPPEGNDGVPLAQRTDVFCKELRAPERGRG